MPDSELIVIRFQSLMRDTWVRDVDAFMVLQTSKPMIEGMPQGSLRWKTKGRTFGRMCGYCGSEIPSNMIHDFEACRSGENSIREKLGGALLD